MKKGYLTTSDKARIYFEDRGHGTPILFVPGHMCTVRFFDKNAAELEQCHRVIVMDPRGFGNSSKVLHGNSVERHAEDIKELIEFLKLEQVMLIGWSMSGSTVVSYAHKYGEEHLKALGLLDAALFPFSSGGWNSYTARDYNMDEWNEKYGGWVLEPKVYYNNFINRLDCGLKVSELELVRSEIQKTPPWIGYAVHSDWCHTDADRHLKELNIPVFLAFGELELEQSTMGRHYYEEIKTYKELHEFKRGGHVFFWVDSRNFDEELLQFMRHIEEQEMIRKQVESCANELCPIPGSAKLSDYVECVNRFGVSNFILASDAGHNRKGWPAEELRIFAQLLGYSGVKEEQLKLMMKDNYEFLLGLS